jgi:hypothetical protein
MFGRNLLPLCSSYKEISGTITRARTLAVAVKTSDLKIKTDSDIIE